MNNWLNRLERKFGKYAIHNLPMMIAVFYVLGFVLNLISNGNMYIGYLSLNPYMILHGGQPWRILTFLFAVSETNIIYLLFAVLFYYSIGNNLCYVWGDFKFNLYILFGIVFTILGAFAAYFVTGNPFIYMDCQYIYLSMFLAFATIFPEMQVYLMGILPLKVKWLAYLDVAVLIWSLIGSSVGTKIAIVISLLNFLIFFFSSRNMKKYAPKERRRQKAFQQQVKVQPKGNSTRHQCAICKRTEKDDPSLEFRYCSKCNGEYEYCNEHLFTHTHVK